MIRKYLITKKEMRLWHWNQTDILWQGNSIHTAMSSLFQFEAKYKAMGEDCDVLDWTLNLVEDRGM